jgi:hypothetical protein
MNRMPSDAIKSIIFIAKAQEQFWSQSRGWAPSEAAALLEVARLDRQLSFAHTLHGYLAPFPPNAAEARQILGYATLRSMCEGALKLFFSVYFDDYKIDQDAKYHTKKGKRELILPKAIWFDALIPLYAKKGEKKFDPFLQRVQQRGNAIHHFNDRDIGTQSELIADIIEFNDFLVAVDGQLPYPD